MTKLPLATAVEKVMLAYPDESWALLILRALPEVVDHYLPGEQVALRWQEDLETTNGTVYWQPDPGRFVIVLRPIGTYRPPEDVVRTALHEVYHIRAGHISKGEQLATWIQPDGTVSETEQDRLIARRAIRPEVNLIAKIRERLADRWADQEMATLGL